MLGCSGNATDDPNDRRISMSDQSQHPGFRHRLAAEPQPPHRLDRRHGASPPASPGPPRQAPSATVRASARPRFRSWRLARPLHGRPAGRSPDRGPRRPHGPSRRHRDRRDHRAAGEASRPGQRRGEGPGADARKGARCPRQGARAADAGQGRPRRDREVPHRAGCARRRLQQARLAGDRRGGGNPHPRAAAQARRPSAAGRPWSGSATALEIGDKVAP